MWQLLARLARQLPAEAAHQLAVETLRWQLGPRLAIESGPIDLAVTLGGVTFPNPVGLAAGFDKNAEVYNIIKNADKYGINVDQVSVNFKKNVKRSRDVSARLSKGIEFLMKKNNVVHINGVGRLITNDKIEVQNGNNKKIIESENIVIATGARPRSFPGMKFDGRRVISSKEAMSLESPPDKMIIIGSGAIGCEFAYYFNEFGTQVHLLEMEDRILPNEDLELSLIHI